MNQTISSFHELEPLLPKFSKKISRKVLKKVKCFYTKKYPPGVTYASYSQILSLPKYINPIKMHHLEGDLFLHDSFDEEMPLIKGFLGNLNGCKQRMSCLYDNKLEIYSFNVQSQDPIFTPFEYVIHVLNSKNDKFAHEIAEKIKCYSKNLDFIKKKSIQFELPHKNDVFYRRYQEKVNEIKMEYSRTACVISFKNCFIPDKNTFEVVEVSFNGYFVKMLGVSHERFIQETMKKGFPDVFGVSGNYYEWLNEILNRSGYFGPINSRPLTCTFVGDDEENCIECQLLIKNEAFTNESYFENNFIMICIPKSKGKALNLKTYDLIEDFNNFGINSQGDEFLKTFYPKSLKFNEDSIKKVKNQ